jgi:flavin-dependent dehydrogenase
MQLQCDVLVLGGGPAGMAAALMLQRKGFAVLVVERSRYDAARPGEWLSPSAETLLSTLEVREEFANRSALEPAPPTVSIWGDSAAASNASHQGWFINRTEFDATLARAATAAGVLVYCDLRPSAAMRVRRGWRVNLDSNGSRASVESRYLVDATGRAAWLARRMRARRQSVDRLVAFVARYANAPSARSLLVEAAPDGWWYSVPCGDKSTMAVYLTDDDYARNEVPATFFQEHLRESSHTRRRVQHFAAPSIRVLPAATYNFDHCAGDRWVSVGEAAFSIDPLSGCGIARALQSGINAAEAISASLGGDRRALAHYQRDADSQFDAQLDHRHHYYGLERRWPSSRFWSRRQN